ncbi:MAG: hypothetical protein GY940_39485, partial [bacterium]|nr:hypothetical protein [bacterium]
RFPDAHVHRLDSETLLEPVEKESEETIERYDYIVATGCKTHDAGLLSFMPRLQSLLKPGGVAAAAVYGYAGYYGLDMLGTIVRKFSRTLKNIPDNKRFAKTVKITKSVMSQLPGSHPAYRQKEFMDRLEKGDKKSVKELIAISGDTVFAVSELLESIRHCGGSFVDWVFPQWYNPARRVEEKSVVEQLSGLPAPQRWEVAELVNSRPLEHYFFMGKADRQAVNVPWDSGDLSWWRPRQLPAMEIEGLDPLPLHPWQEQLCHASTGALTLDQLLAEKELNGRENPLKEQSHSEIIDFLKRAVNYRLITLFPPGAAG